jgi:hypothetical protein
MTAPYDLVIRGGTVADGTGGRPSRRTSPWPAAGSPRWVPSAARAATRSMGRAGARR